MIGRFPIIITRMLSDVNRMQLGSVIFSAIVEINRVFPILEVARKYNLMGLITVCLDNISGYLFCIFHPSSHHFGRKGLLTPAFIVCV